MTEPSVGVGVYGKVRTQGDFVRAGAGEFSQAGLDRWLEEAMGVLRTERTALPEGAPAGFLFAPADSGRAFVGALVPSEDGVGRKFPLLIFVDAPAGAATAAWPALPALHAPFVRAAGALALDCLDRPGAELVTRTKQLAVPGLVPPAAGDAPVELSREPSVALRAALGGSPPALAYALRTFSLACDQAFKTGGGVTGITVDAPGPSAEAREMWLELALLLGCAACRHPGARGGPVDRRPKRAPPHRVRHPCPRHVGVLGESTAPIAAPLASPDRRGRRRGPSHGRALRQPAPVRRRPERVPGTVDR